MHPRFLTPGPALLIERSQRVLVVADPHFGAEAELARRGVHISSNSSARLARLCACIDAAEPDLLVLLGDVKHSIPVTTRQEYAELPGILATLRERVPLRILPGNHDVGIGRFCEDGELLAKDGAVIDGIGYLHGHTFPGPGLYGRLMVMGHHHPVVHLYDEVGCALRAHPAYLLAVADGACLGSRMPPDLPEPTRVLFMPAFFELAGGLDVREIPASGLSPMARCLRTDDAEVFLEDGTYIDTLSALAAEQDS
ncbi:MAG: metallophosphoesterase [Methanomicrobiales archaeon]|nr:metallophosphoesterase [Methanomicrobiales archaeon]